MRILFIEDNIGDQVIVKEAFKEAKVSCDLDVVVDAVEAQEFLNRQGAFKTALRPELIILDLNLPRKNGHEFTAEIKQNPRFKHIPILVLSNSSSPTDICRSYDLGVSVYVKKPAGFQGFVDLAQMVEVFWVKLVCYCYHNGQEVSHGSH